MKTLFLSDDLSYCTLDHGWFMEVGWMGMVLQLDHVREGVLIDRMRFNQEIGQVIKIGRLPSAHFYFHDPLVSRLHAIIEFRADGAWLVDMGSDSGSRINSRIVTRATCLTDGDVIGIGDQEIRVTLLKQASRIVGQPLGLL